MGVLFCANTLIFQSTLPLRGATVVIADNPHCCLISIHTPLAGSDRQPADHAVGRHISIRTPLAGSDRQCRVDGETLGISIHTPLAGSDRPLSHSSFRTRYFNPHSPCGERRVPLTYASCICQFQSTLPLRGATRLQKQSGMTIKISIHTPLAGSDQDDDEHV